MTCSAKRSRQQCENVLADVFVIFVMIFHLVLPNVCRNVHQTFLCITVTVKVSLKAATFFETYDNSATFFKRNIIILKKTSLLHVSTH